MRYLIPCALSLVFASCGDNHDTSPTARCGDGIVASGEACDDGNTTAGDGCSATCEVEHGFACDGEPSSCATTCGDGVVAGDEACDDHNTATGDGCDATCAKEPGWVCSGEPSTCVATCGDGVISGAEACDDHDLTAGDGCDANCAVEHGFACAGAPSACASTCGDGVVASDERCDDHNTAAGDGCDASCELEHGFACANEPSACASACGDGKVASDEACDDGNPVPGDGCDGSCEIEHGFGCAGEASTCTSICGDGVVASDEACDDGDSAPGDGCDAGCARETGWSCSGDPTTCTAICGDGVQVGAEECDDHDLVDLDGCNHTCAIDVFAESESNDTPATADGPFPTDVRITGWISGPIDVDYYAITVATTSDLAFETFDVDGIGVCNNADTRVTVYAPDGTTALATDDDSGLGRCSKIAPDSAPVAHLAPGTYYVKVESFANDQLIPGYNLVVRALARCGDGTRAGAEECDGGPGCTATCDRTPSCGDGFVDGAEQCDDGNAADGDGCTSGCAYALLSETEPDDAAATANGPFPAQVLLGGAIATGGDVDFYAITLPVTTDLTVETFDGSGPGHCTGIDTTVALYDPTGTLLLARDQGGIGACSRIDPARAADHAARHLPAGTYFVAVRDFNSDTTIPAYQLLIGRAAVCGDGVVAGAEECDGGAGCTSTCDRVPVCGDGLVDAPEACDDHDTVDGDGCSAACILELVSEIEPNNTAATANTVAATTLLGGAIAPIGDNDYFAITLTTTTDLAIATSRPDAACDIDTEIYFYAPDGTTQLATNDDGGSAPCSALSPTTDAAMRHLAPGTYYLRVHDFGDDSTIPAYRASVTATASCGDGVVEGSEECDGGAGCTATCDRVPICGDGYIDAPETCDDGNTAGGDGCAATCALELAAEIEPNDSLPQADVGGLTLTGARATVSGAISPIGDLDTFKLVLPVGGVYAFETSSAPGACTIATTLTIFDSGGTTLYTDTNSGIATCSALRLSLAAGAYYVRVGQRNNTATIASYLLSISSIADGGAEAEPDSDRATSTVATVDAYVLGAHQTAIDLDYFAVTVPPGKSLRAEVIEGSTAETCESSGIDSTLTLFDAAGVVLARDDDSGRGLCSLIDATNLAGGVYYIAVDASAFAQTAGSDAAQFDYRLVVELR